MRRTIPILAMTVLFHACSGSSTSPSTPPPSANVQPQGSVTTSACGASSQLFRCAAFSGTAMNMGPGCAANVRGVVTTYTTASNTSGLAANTQVGSAAWNHTGIVRANEQIEFSGGPITIGAPLFGGWYYQNNLSWDSVTCP